MKVITTTLSLFILLGFFVPPANANLINIISETHTVSGFIDSGDYYSYTTYTTGSSPSISGEIMDGYNNITSGAGNFNVYAQAWGDYRHGAYAESKYVFTSDENSLSMNYYGIATTSNWYESAEIFISLKDLTTNSLLLSDKFSVSCYGPEVDDFMACVRATAANSFDETFSYYSGDHQYELIMIADAYLGEGGGHYSNMTIDFSSGVLPEPNIPIPEPAAMLLFSIGLVGLAGARVRKKK